MTLTNIAVIIGFALVGGVLSTLIFRLSGHRKKRRIKAVSPVEDGAATGEEAPVEASQSRDPIAELNAKVSELASLQMSLFSDIKSKPGVDPADLDSRIEKLEDRLVKMIERIPVDTPPAPPDAEELAEGLNAVVSDLAGKMTAEIQSAVAPIAERLANLEEVAAQPQPDTEIDFSDLQAALADGLQPLASLQTQVTALEATLAARVSVEVERIETLVTNRLTALVGQDHPPATVDIGPLANDLADLLGPMLRPPGEEATPADPATNVVPIPASDGAKTNAVPEQIRNRPGFGAMLVSRPAKGQSDG